MNKLVVSLFMLFILAACGSVSSRSVQGQWILISYGSPSDQILAVPNVETSIEFKDGQLSGNVGCNGFGGEYSVDGDTITFGPIMSTMMFCEAVADQESITLAVFQESATFVMSDNLLTITSMDGNSVIVLERK